MPWPKGGAGVVEMSNGVRVRGRGLHDPNHFDDPDFGVYLLARPPKDLAWPHRWIRWPDWWLPSDRSAAVAILLDALDRAADERVEVACKAGRGRTGAALAVMAVACGVPRDVAVKWVRDNYNPKAVETPCQRRWISQLCLPARP